MDNLDLVKTSQKRMCLTFASALCVELVSGTPYAFSAIGPQLLQRFGYTSTQTGIVAAGGCLGLYLSGPLAGFIVDQHGPNKVLAVAALLGFFGYFFMALSYFGVLSNTHYLLLAAYYAMVGISSSAANSAALSTVVRNVPPTRRGLVVGVCVSFFGLSALVFSRIRQIWLPGVHTEGTGDKTGWYLILLALALGTVNIVAATLILDPSRQRQQYQELPNSVETKPQSITRYEFFKSTSTWLLFFTFLLITTAGLMVINNVGQVAVAVYGDVPYAATAQNLQVSVLSLANCFGRLIHGFGSDWAAHRCNISKLSFLALAAILEFLGLGLFALSDGHSLPWTYTALIGLGYGGSFAIVPTLVGDWFGLQNFATNWGWMSWAPAVGTQLGTLLFGWVFDSHSSAPGQCFGRQCYQLTYFITACGCLFSVLLTAAWLTLRRFGSLTRHGAH